MNNLLLVAQGKPYNGAGGRLEELKMKWEASQYIAVIGEAEVDLGICPVPSVAFNRAATYKIKNDLWGSKIMVYAVESDGTQEGAATLDEFCMGILTRR